MLRLIIIGLVIGVVVALLMRRRQPPPPMVEEIHPLERSDESRGTLRPGDIEREQSDRIGKEREDS